MPKPPLERGLEMWLVISSRVNLQGSLLLSKERRARGLASNDLLPRLAVLQLLFARQRTKKASRKLRCNKSAPSKKRVAIVTSSLRHPFARQDRQYGLPLLR